MPPGESPRTPAQVLRLLNERIRAEQLPVDVRLAVQWIFLRRRGFEISAFGDARQRDRRLGKWIVELEASHLLDAVARLLPAIGRGPLALAKFSNIFNVPHHSAIIVAYCLEGDTAVRAALEALGWQARFKLNRETFAPRDEVGPARRRRDTSKE